MQPPQQHSWINLSELKGKLIKKLGPEKSTQYFHYLNRFLSLKLSKVEFDKLCVRTVGKDNIPLHNQLIRSVLKNACTRKAPPVGNLSDSVYHQNGAVPVVASSPVALSNGDVLPPSPRKARSGTRERRVGDRRSALGPNGKSNYGPFQSGALENGNLSPDTRRPLQHHQDLTQETQKRDDVLGHDNENKQLGRKDMFGRTSLHAPLGVSIGGAHKVLPLVSSSKCVGALDTCGLLDMITLRDRMEQIGLSQGLQGVTMDCANALNAGLDAYLKRLIRPCTELNSARSTNGPITNMLVKHPSHARPLNGITPGHHYQMQNGDWAFDMMQEREPKRPISLLDFRVATELNSRRLGEDWPVMLERICTHTFEE